jgi:zinc transport system ATP-binding protein
MLKIDHLTVTYGPTIAVSDASLAVGDGEFVVITGSNGSGKSSLLRSVLGLAPIASGTVAVDGATARTSTEWQRRRRTAAYVPQRTTPGSFPLLVRELLDSSGNASAAEASARRLGVGKLLDRPLTTLSGGQLQRAYLARAVGSMSGERRLLLADEPTSALDFDGQDDVAKLLANMSATRLVVSHDASVVGKADRVLEMAGGSIRARAA